jgi:hypothetical protein
MSGGSYDLLDGYSRDEYLKINPKTAIDFGAGKGKHGKILRELFPDIKMGAVEVFEPNMIGYEYIYDDTYNNNLLDWLERNNKRYDLAVFGDVIEHLPIQHVYYALYMAHKWFNNIIINVPLRNIDQGVVDGNIYERHLSYLRENSFDIYNVVEKHIVRLPQDKTYFKMNVWIENF